MSEVITSIHRLFKQDSSPQTRPPIPVCQIWNGRPRSLLDSACSAVLRANKRKEKHCFFPQLLTELWNTLKVSQHNSRSYMKNRKKSPPEGVSRSHVNMPYRRHTLHSLLEKFQVQVILDAAFNQHSGVGIRGALL